MPHKQVVVLKKNKKTYSAVYAAVFFKQRSSKTDKKEIAPRGLNTNDKWNLHLSIVPQEQ